MIRRSESCSEGHPCSASGPVNAELLPPLDSCHEQGDHSASLRVKREVPPGSKAYLRCLLACSSCLSAPGSSLNLSLLPWPPSFRPPWRRSTYDGKLNLPGSQTPVSALHTWQQTPPSEPYPTATPVPGHHPGHIRQPQRSTLTTDTSPSPSSWLQNPPTTLQTPVPTGPTFPPSHPLQLYPSFAPSVMRWPGADYCLLSACRAGPWSNHSNLGRQISLQLQPYPSSTAAVRRRPGPGCEGPPSSDQGPYIQWRVCSPVCLCAAGSHLGPRMLRA